VIRSMTGFGEASGALDGIHASVEVRTLNNRFFKCVLRLPEELQPLEADLDARLRRRVVRGSTTLTVRLSDTTATAASTINVAALASYLEAIHDLPEHLLRETTIDVAGLLDLPGVLQPPGDLESRLDRIKGFLLDLVDEACDRLLDMRRREGRLLLEDLKRHGDDIRMRLEAVDRRAPAVVEEYQQRLQQRIERMLEDAEVGLEPGDLIREVAIYAERSDISEEVARLGGHLGQFRDLIDDSGDKPVGRTLDFIAQEMLREANTIASKSNDSEISRDIVEVKGAIDRIKEQVQNVE